MEEKSFKEKLNLLEDDRERERNMFFPTEISLLMYHFALCNFVYSRTHRDLEILFYFIVTFCVIVIKNVI